MMVNGWVGVKWLGGWKVRGGRIGGGGGRWEADAAGTGRCWLEWWGSRWWVRAGEEVVGQVSGNY